MDATKVFYICLPYYVMQSNLSETYAIKDIFKTRILWFSAYALTIFTEYTAWATWCSGDLPFYNRNANEVLNMHIWWWQAHMVILIPTTTHIPRFVTVAHTELWIYVFCY